MLLFLYQGSKKSETAPENQPAPTAWSGDFLSGIEKRAAVRPEPLWRPVCEEEAKVRGSSPEVSKPSNSKISQGDMPPPSPRTLKAIEAAMEESSDEENGDSGKKDASLSPRTLLAIHKALAEEEEGSADQESLIHISPPKHRVNILHPSPQVVVISSEEEPHSSSLIFLPDENSKVQRNPTSQHVHVKDSLLVSSSEDEMEEVIGQRNKALRSALLEDTHEKETKNGQLIEDLRAGSRGQTEKQEELERGAGLTTSNGDLVQLQGETASSLNNLPNRPPAQICGKPLSAETENDSVVSEQTKDKSTEEDRLKVKSEASEESESEGTVILDPDQIIYNFSKHQSIILFCITESFIEVSEEEFNEEDKDDQLVMIREKRSPENVDEDRPEEEKITEESLSDASNSVNTKEEDDKIRATEEKELKEQTETESGFTPAVNEWEHLDTVSVADGCFLSDSTCSV